MSRLRCFFSLALLLHSGLVLGAEEPARQLRRITLLHTSDIHGRVLPHDDARDQPAAGSLARLATLVDRIRSEVTHPVLLLDSGDTIQGTPLEQFALVRFAEQSPTIAAMNRIGYSAMALGNHEFNFGLDVLRRVREQAAFPLLSANTQYAASGEPAFDPFLVIEAGDIRIGVLGLTTSNIAGWESPENYQGLVFQATEEAARRWVPVLREQQRCDLVVVLAHTGFERDLASGAANSTNKENSAWRLSTVPGVDVLLTGHTHRDIEPRQLHGAIVSQPSSGARRLTRIDLDFEPAAKGWSLVSWQGKNLDPGEQKPDPELIDSFADLHARVVKALDSPIGHTTSAVSVRGCRLADCAACDLLHDVQLEASGADLSLASLLSDSTPDLAAGAVTWRWIFGLYVFSNTLQAITVSGAQVRDILEHAASYYTGLECTAATGCTLLTDPEVLRFNVDSMAGLSYHIDPTRPLGERIRDLSFAGLPWDPERVFTLVCNSYRGAGGGGFPHIGEAPVVWRSSEEMTDLVADYLTLHDPWQPRADHNWRVVPEIVAEQPLPGAR